MKETHAAVRVLRERAKVLTDLADALVKLNDFSDGRGKWTRRKKKVKVVKKVKRTLSVKGREAIRKAQKARWAMVRKNRKLQVVA